MNIFFFIFMFVWWFCFCENVTQQNEKYSSDIFTMKQCCCVRFVVVPLDKFQPIDEMLLKRANKEEWKIEWHIKRVCDFWFSFFIFRRRLRNATIMTRKLPEREQKCQCKIEYCESNFLSFILFRERQIIICTLCLFFRCKNVTRFQKHFSGIDWFIIDRGGERKIW